MVELGNFDSFYDQGLTFSAEDVLEMTRKTRSLLPSVPLSVTVPHTLDLDEQVRGRGARKRPWGNGVLSVSSWYVCGAINITVFSRLGFFVA